MRRLTWLGLLLAAGCQGVEGPRARRANPVQVDNPYLSIPQQERLGRDRLALPVQDPNVAPRLDSAVPLSPHLR